MSSTATLPNILHSFPPSPPESAYNRRNQNFTNLSPRHRHRKPTYHPADKVAPRVSGLRTPPFDDMGTTYQPASLAPYEGHQAAPLPTYHTSVAQVDRARSTRADIQNGHDNYSRYQAYSSQQQPQSQAHARHALYSTPSAPIVAPHPTSRHSTRPSTPNSAHTIQIGSGGSATSRVSSRDSQAMVLHSLQVPACISPRGGNLADFSAHLTCLLWFESPKTMEAAEKVHTLAKHVPVRRLTENAIPSLAFKKWVQTVLSTTQVTQNVILLALMFVYRLKMTNPTVRGQPGSEYRLLTVALMLGNKFLDDNTYTNKTWAEVSGISVQEIHVMEVEFLSNMKYALLASKEQWEEWLEKLAQYFEYCDRATRPTSPLVIPSPTYRSFQSPLPSPTTTLQSTFVQSISPPSTNSSNLLYTPHESSAYPSNATSISSWPTPYHATPALSPLANRPDLGNNRKRSMAEEHAAGPPAKRANRPQPLASTALPDPIRLPVPNLAVNTTHSTPASQPQYTPSTYANQSSAPLSLPPLTSGTRAMATVYPSAATSWAHHPPVLSTSGPAMPAISQATSTTHYPSTHSGYGTPTKRLSPINTLNPAAAYGTSSPMTEHYPHHGGHTPISHSPSVYLQQRPSPYKPIRHVNTLLYPPPSASLHQYHLSGTAVPPTQMHYQPLGRRNEFRTGIVPDYQNQMMYGGNGRQQHPSAPSQQRMAPNEQYPN